MSQSNVLFLAHFGAITTPLTASDEQPSLGAAVAAAPMPARSRPLKREALKKYQKRPPEAHLATPRGTKATRQIGVALRYFEYAGNRCSSLTIAQFNAMNHSITFTRKTVLSHIRARLALHQLDLYGKAVRPELPPHKSAGVSSLGELLLNGAGDFTLVGRPPQVPGILHCPGTSACAMHPLRLKM